VFAVGGNLGFAIGPALVAPLAAAFGLAAASAAALVPLAAAGALVLRRRRAGVWILLSPIVVVSVAALLTYGNQRFREPAELSLVVLAAVALDALWRGRVGRARAMEA
jgi:hypothetical protein